MQFFRWGLTFLTRARYLLRPSAIMILAGLTLHLAWHYGPGFRLAAAALFVWLLVALAVIDMEQSILPDRLTLFLVWSGLAVNLQGLFAPLQSAVIGAMAGYLGFRLILETYRFLAGRDGLGLGDCKLAAALGAWVGWELLPFTVLVAVSGQFLVTGIFSLAGKGGLRSAIPFGPSLALGGWAALLWGSALTSRVAA